MKFKTSNLITELEDAPAKLREICEVFDQLSQGYADKEATVTRVLEKVHGSSGVHEAHRAVDFRDETRDIMGDQYCVYTFEEATLIVDEMNKRFPRDDGKLTCIHHSFKGGMYHFHVQIPASWL